MLNGGDQTDTLSVTGHDGVDSLSSNTNTNDESEAFLQLTEDGGTTDFAHYTGFEQLKVELGGGDDLASIGDLTTAGTQIVRLGLDPSAESDGAHDEVNIDGAVLRPNRIRIQGSPSTGATVSFGTSGVLVSGAEAMTVFGGADNDVIDAAGLVAGTLKLTEFTDIGFRGDVLVGSPGDDTLIAGPGDDRIVCRGGNDIVDHGLGNDTIIC